MEWTPATVDENQRRVIDDIKEIFNIQDSDTFSVSPKTSANSSEQQKTKCNTYMAQQKAIYANAYERWSDEDDQKLLYLYSKGKTIYELMNIFSRNEGAIRSRLTKLTE